MAATWRIFEHSISLQPDKTKLIVKATCVLHNFLQKRKQTIFTPDTDGIDGSWRESTSSGLGELTTVGRPAAQTAKEVRNTFREYFNGVGAVEWQERMIGN